MSAPPVGTEGAGRGRREKSWEREPGRGGGLGMLQGPQSGFVCFLQVNNLSQRDLPISVHFWVPVLLHGVAVWDVALVAPSQVPASLLSLPRV